MTHYQTLCAERDALARVHDELSQRKSAAFAAWQAKCREVDAAFEAEHDEFLNGAVFTGSASEKRLLELRLS